MRMVVTAPTAKVYGRAMKAGDEFDCPEKEARLWTALARAKSVGGDSVPEQTNDLESLRSRYRTSTGRNPDMRWGVERLQRETSSPGTYGRRDMRAED